MTALCFTAESMSPTIFPSIQNGKFGTLKNLGKIMTSAWLSATIEDARFVENFLEIHVLFVASRWRQNCRSYRSLFITY